MRKVILMVVLAGMYAGCAPNSEVVSIGHDTYMVSRKASTVLSSAGTLQAEAFQEATRFCKGQGKSLQVKYTTEVDQPYIDQRVQVLLNHRYKFHKWILPNAEIQFMCQAARGTELQHSKLQIIPYQVINIEQGAENTGEKIWVMQLNEVNELLILQQKNTNELQDSLLSPKMSPTYIRTKY